MAYEFKRLSDVEKLDKAPEGASALAESDGNIVRVPFPAGGGGNADLEDMMFDLDVTMYTSGQIMFTNEQQMQKVYDNNMTVHVVYCTESSGSRHVFECACPSVKTVLPIGTASGGAIVFANGYYHNSHANARYYIGLYFDASKFAADETLEVTGGSYMMIPANVTVARVYASIF